ncbi:uncharacterized protein LOC114798514 [Denticeps clupeoides]|uniref:uncharacterized protein LOC114798514 n=1 Tax=Denticeps clupeoides TaxID=299321 RepID=UPI0010A42EDF|nr:uncharacterized protein LOC114798514 [Denticeps clupeoides]
MENYEIYVPEDSGIGLLPPSIISRLGFEQSYHRDPRGAFWVSPVVFRKRDHRDWPAEPGEVSTSRWSFQVEVKQPQGQHSLPIISANFRVFKLLKYFLPQGNTSHELDHQFNTDGLPQIPLSDLSQDGIILYQHKVFLSLTNTRRFRRRVKRSHPCSLPCCSPTEMVSKSLRGCASHHPQSKALLSEMKAADDRAYLRAFNIRHQLFVRLAQISATRLQKLWYQGRTLKLDENPAAFSPDDGRQAVKPASEVPVDTSFTAEPTNSNDQNQEAPAIYLSQQKEGMDVLTSSGSELKEIDMDGDNEDRSSSPSELRNGNRIRNEPTSPFKAETEVKKERSGEPHAVEMCAETPGSPARDSDDNEGVKSQRGEEETLWRFGNEELPDEGGAMPTPFVSSSSPFGFDFELSARAERIHRIRALLREKEAALSTCKDLV